MAIWAAAPDRRRRRRAAVPFLGSGSSKCVIVDLQRDGFARWGMSVERVQDLITSYGQIREDRARGTRTSVDRHTSKPFFEPDLSPQDLQDYPVFLDTALDSELLQVIINATGLVPHLEAVEVMVSNPVSAKLDASQLWHRDVNDSMILKLFIYLSDVGSENGPLNFIPSGASNRVPHMSHYNDDATIKKFVEADMWRQIEGPAGTAFIIDTHNCLHCGSRCQKQRVAYIATYSSGLKFMHQAQAWGSILGKRVGHLNALQKRVLDLE